MKKLFCVLICMMLCAACAQASGMPAFPFPFTMPDEGQSDVFPPANDVSDSIEITVDGREVSLAFDPTPEYSYAENGIVQASFFAYTDNDEYLYELFMVYPENVTAGTTVTPEYAMAQGKRDCSVLLIVSDNTDQYYYWALIMNNAAYPQNADYDIRFDSVSQNASGTVYAGELSATLVDVDMITGETRGSLRIEGAPFSFTMSGAAASPAVPENPFQAPAPEMPFPAATPTVRPDMFRI